MTDATMVAQDHLRSFVERIERLEEEKKGIADDIKDVYAEAKGNGFDTKVLRKVIALRKQDANERAEQDAILDLYLEALGMAQPTAELPMEMERVRRADRPKSGIDQLLADRAAEVREKIGLGPAAVEVTIKPAAAKPSKSTKPKTADEARERLAALSPNYD